MSRVETTRTTSPYRFVCRHCGRQWDTEGRSRSGNPARDGKSNVTGFIAAAADAHARFCAARSPAERVATNRRDETRWALSPPKASRIWNDHTHPGLRE